MDEFFGSRTDAHTLYMQASGRIVPGASTIAKLCTPHDEPPEGLLIWANRLGLQGKDYRLVRDEQAARGSCGHLMIEQLIKGIEPDWNEWTPYQVEAGKIAFKAFQRWAEKHELEPIFSERELTSELNPFGGTVDLYAYVDGEATLIDFKTSSAIRTAHKLQVAAYKSLLEEFDYPVEQVIVLKLPRSGTRPRATARYMTEKELEYGWEAFLSWMAADEYTRMMEDAA